MNKLVAATALAGLVLASCAGVPFYRTTLRDVAVNGSVPERQPAIENGVLMGESITIESNRRVKQPIGHVSSFEDERVALRISFHYYHAYGNFLRIEVRNKGARRLFVDWDECTFVDANQVSSRLIHRGVALSELAMPTAPSIIEPGSSISDILYPAAYVKTKMRYSGKPKPERIAFGSASGDYDFALDMKTIGVTNDGSAARIQINLLLREGEAKALYSFDFDVGSGEAEE